jgi:hypothetical protein
VLSKLRTNFHWDWFVESRIIGKSWLVIKA